MRIQEALRDAVDKYKRVNAATYGRLRYILIVIMAGGMMSVYGMPLIADLQKDDLKPLVPPFEVGWPLVLQSSQEQVISISTCTCTTV